MIWEEVIVIASQEGDRILLPYLLFVRDRHTFSPLAHTHWIHNNNHTIFQKILPSLTHTDSPQKKRKMSVKEYFQIHNIMFMISRLEIDISRSPSTQNTNNQKLSNWMSRNICQGALWKWNTFLINFLISSRGGRLSGADEAEIGRDLVLTYYELQLLYQAFYKIHHFSEIDSCILSRSEVVWSRWDGNCGNSNSHP